MNGIRPQVAREEALRLLQRRHRGWLKRLLGWGTPKNQDSGRSPGAVEAPKLELVWLPCHHLKFPLSKESRQGDIQLLIGGHDAVVTRLKGHGLELQTVDDQELFAPIVTIEEALKIAREQITLARVREPGWSNQDVDVGQPTIGQWQYPYWAYYYERRKGMLDVLLLDAVTGKPVGNRTKVAFLTAITAEKNADTPP